MSKSRTISGVSAVFAASTAILTAEGPRTFEAFAGPFLEQYCFDCHDADTQKGDIAFHELKGVEADDAELWKRIWEQVALREMPPRKKKNQPEPMERLQLSSWITGELEEAMKDRGGFQTHLLPAKGNHLDHDLLFGKIPEGLDPPSTPARIWRVAPQEHLVRLNELINKEPAYSPSKPGVRTHGDHIPWNEQGEVKVYYGLDRLIGWVGGSAAYAAAITGFPPILSTAFDHGLRNYPVLYSVNGAEATQIASHAEDILRFMAYGPAAEPYQFADNVNQIDNKYKDESVRGYAQSLFYSNTPMRPLTPVYELMKEPGISESKLRAAVDYLFEALTFRPPTAEESESYLSLAKEAIADLGEEDGAILGLVPIFLDRDALFRPELAASGTPDAHGRVMLQDQELALAINAAFSYIAPDLALKDAVQQGRLRSRDDVKREVARILEDDSVRKPRVLQFFREYFDYDRAGRICKDMTALKQAGGKDNSHYPTMFGMTAETDRLIELILQEDKNVLRELLTTDRVVLDPGKDLLYFSEFEKLGKNAIKPVKGEKLSPEERAARAGHTVLPKGEAIHVRVAEVVRGGNTQRTLTTLPAEQRMGILTHPSWLVSQSDAMDNHAIHRGKWIRERLLGGAVPDVPITVDAMLPDEPNATLRHRMRVTSEEYCWKCHQNMDPLGLPFEMYNHLGLYRTTEQGEPVDSSGEIINSGDPALDGPVENALEMIRKLAESERVEQVFVRHAFRYWMGRNETVEDAPVLQDAWHAYRDNGGSMKALIAALVTSDAFLYRKVEGPAQRTRGAGESS
jgi:hypothetical protein